MLTTETEEGKSGPQHSLKMPELASVSAKKEVHLPDSFRSMDVSVAAALEFWPPQFVRFNRDEMFYAKGDRIESCPKHGGCSPSHWTVHFPVSPQSAVEIQVSGRLRWGQALAQCLELPHQKQAPGRLGLGLLGLGGQERQESGALILYCHLLDFLFFITITEDTKGHINELSQEDLGANL